MGMRGSIMVGGRRSIMRWVEESGNVVGGGVGEAIEGTIKAMYGKTASYTSELRSSYQPRYRMSDPPPCSQLTTTP